jgi:ABC-type transport system involved in multi-copper enzyme maturation permease subunit
LRAKRTRAFYVLSILPVVIACVIKLVPLFSDMAEIEGMYAFTNIIMVFYLQFLILLGSLFFGTSVCSEELEGKTLTYLTSRPVYKSSILVGKYASYTLILIGMTGVGVILSFFVLNVDGLFQLDIYMTLLKDLGVLILGLACYTAFFTMIGTFLKKSILFGLIFSFGWENVIQYFPGSTQRFAIVHYLKSLLPLPTSGRFSFLLFRLEPTSPGISVLVLLLLTAVFLAVACLVFTFKEYILSD